MQPSYLLSQYEGSPVQYRSGLGAVWLALVRPGSTTVRVLVWEGLRTVCPVYRLAAVVREELQLTLLESGLEGIVRTAGLALPDRREWMDGPV